MNQEARLGFYNKIFWVTWTLGCICLATILVTLAVVEDPEWNLIRILFAAGIISAVVLYVTMNAYSKIRQRSS